jgi:mono/diheme cytochrome c family protein/glucose/arabinose dehydrogenase
MYKALGKIFLCIVLLWLISCSENSDSGPSPAQTPEEELTSFEISSDLSIQLVASEPMIQDPVVINFDEEGRLWVVEMRGFMADIKGSGEKEKSGRVSVLEDTDGDGRMDKSTIYIDSLIMPRALALVRGGALIAENDALWLTEDIDGDLHADSKILIDPDYAGSSLPEHSGNGLWRGVDNKYYNVKSRLRYFFEDGQWKRDSTEFRGQWGMSHDDEGRLFYNYNWSQLHADLVPPNSLLRNKNHTPTTGIDHGLTTERRIYPIRPNPAVNRGYVSGVLDQDGRLIEFTAACSPFYFRGNALPETYYGNAFVCEPSGNLIKCNVVNENGFTLTAHDPTPGKEFLASTDERFRPVYLTSGPDGALYVADMYKGMIQYGAYATPYLREQTLSRKLDQPVHCGRIWRIGSKNSKPTGVTKLSKASTEELISQLSSPNGWTRDIAQRLLVEKNDSSSIRLLKEMILKDENHLARFHALWTLQGLKSRDTDFLFEVLKDKNAIVRITALRMLEPIAKVDDKAKVRLQEYLFEKCKEAPVKEILQMTLTASVLDEGPSINLLCDIINRYDSSSLMRDAVLSSLQDREFSFLQNLMNFPDWNESKPSQEIFIEMLATSVVRKRNSSELEALLSRLDKNKSWKEKAILTALTIQGKKSNLVPIKLQTVPSLLTRNKSSLDSGTWSILSSMFEWPGHVPSPVVIEKNKLDENQQLLFTEGRQHYLTNCAGCHGTDGAGVARFAPTLVGSEWVLGDERRLALITLHGMEGAIEVNGKRYDIPEILPVMPAHITLDDEVITSILMYIRNEWGNHAGPVERRTVGVARNRSQGRVKPWTVKDLEEYLRSTQDVK